MTEKLERILVGDDRIDFARANFPFIPDSSVDFTESHTDCIKKGRSGQYSLIVTDLEYTPGGREGFEVLEALKYTNSRKILWTGAAHLQEVQEKARELGVELLSKEEIGSLVGQVASHAPLKKDGIALIYSPNENSPITRALQQTIGKFNPSRIVVGSDLKTELESGKYGLVIDTTTMLNAGRQKSSHGSVAHDMKYLKLKEVPRVVCIYNPCNILVDTCNIIDKYFTKQGIKVGDLTK